MKAKLLSFIVCALLLVAVDISYSQSVWSTTYLNNIDGNYLRRIQFINTLTGYACGGNGVLVKTINGGDSWVPINAGTSAFMTAIFFLNENTGWVGTNLPLIVKTTDGGASWSNQVFPNGDWVASIIFFNDQTGYAGGPFISGGGADFCKTTNGGATWNVVSTSNSFAWGETKFANQLTGYIEAPNYFAKTTDGGVSWTRLLFEGSNQDFHFINEQTGWVASENVMKKTVNGGNSWTYSPLPINFPYSVKFLNQNIGWCVGSTGASGVISRTINGGINWTVQKVESNNVYYDISFVNSEKGWASGNGIISSTSNGNLVSVSQTSSNLPEQFSLQQNYPNPFNPSTAIRYEIKNSGFVSLKVYDMLGNETASLVNEKQNAGRYAVDFNSTEYNLPSGMYFYTLSAGEFKETRKMVLIK